MSELNAILRNKFDKIYILSLVNRKDRQESLMSQFNTLGIDTPDINNFIRWYYAVTFPYNNIIADSFNYSSKGSFTKPNEYDCAKNHYNIIKICYELGYEDILILEDDILFLKDQYKIIEYLNAIPEDYDILQFGGFTSDQKIKKYLDTNDRWVKHKGVGVWNCSMYALSRRGMEYYLTFMNKFFWVADGPLYKAPINDHLVTTYLSREPIVIQADKNIISSDIRDKSNDTIDYMQDNVYEAEINRSLYFLCNKN